jgi:hypothetical protein
LTKTVRTATDNPSSMVKRSRGQSGEVPRRRSCRPMVPPDSCFHSQTLSTKAARPRSRRDDPWAANSRSTTIWVAMPA